MCRESLVWIAVVALLAAASGGCGESGAPQTAPAPQAAPTPSAQGPEAEADPPKAFDAGTFERFRNEELGFVIEKPDNVVATAADGAVTLSADGFPTLTITMEECEDTDSLTTQEYRTRSGEHVWKAWVGRKAYLCSCSDEGPNAGLVGRICKSMRPIGNPRAVLERLNLTGEMADRAGYEQRLNAALPPMTSCWREALAESPDQGGMGAHFVYAFDGEGKAVRSSHTVSSSKGGQDALEQCVISAFEGVEARAAGAEPVSVNAFFRLVRY